MFKLTTQKLFVFHILVFSTLILYPYILNVDFSLTNIAVSLFVFFLTACLGITMTFHRMLTHKSFSFNSKLIELVFSYFGCLNGTGSSIGWAIIHVDHHEYSDTDKDPHGTGFWKGLGYRTSNFSRNTYKKLGHLFKDPYHNFMHNYYFLLIILHTCVILLLTSVSMFYFLFIVPISLGILASILNNIFTHGNFGYQSYDTKDNSRNVWWVAPWTFGDGWHNNHHAEPWNWNFSHKWYQIDITGIILKMFFTLGLAKENKYEYK